MLDSLGRRSFLASAGGAALGASALGKGVAAAEPGQARHGKRRAPFREDRHEPDFCVVGGGMAGVCAALAAARHGAKVVLIQDRPVLGGNASSECRMHICGADRHKLPHLRETGILEELRLENAHRNPNSHYSIWDLILYEKVRFEPNITLLLNCSCLDAEMKGRRIQSVRAWQLTTQKWHTIRAALFADCSGDAILAPLTGAEFRIGHEARSEYNESIAPEIADRRTMGMTCLFQAREYATPQPFEPPPWIYRFDREEDLPYGAKGHRWLQMGYWWIELGGEDDSIADTESVRDELLKITLGVWDHIKNRGDHGADNWALEWIQFLPGKRESRRYVGDHVLTQNDIEAEGRFDDVVAYGGWSMDDHHSAGFRAVKLGAPATIFHPAPSPYGIPYRSLYSRNVANLMFAGRCISATHVALSSTRVMGTCSVMGQAVGTAAALACAKGIEPRGVNTHMRQLQQMLQDDDCYLPWKKHEFTGLTMRAALTASQGDPEPVRDGVERQIGTDPHAWIAHPGDVLMYTFPAETAVNEATLVLDSAMDKDITLSLHHATPDAVRIPAVMPKTFRVEGLSGGAWETIRRVENNRQRLVRVPVKRTLGGIRFVLEETWGAADSRVYAFHLA
ncbi:MAG TPA: FAD-dependent oxidoreductase [Candidatus Hydrogenedentes bacterium]|nr:FAD-dependent oxidoreductase [Candidatus Hydrogenedentota bacterium]